MCDFDLAWVQAAEDAEITPSTALVRPVNAGPARYGAMHYPPGLWARPGDDAFAYTAEDRDALYRERDRHVIVIDATTPWPRSVLLLRHEAEHVGQDESHPGIGPVAVRIAAALNVEAFYQVMPHERDADAAATDLRTRMGIEVTEQERQGADRMLYEAPWTPPNRASLPLRLLAFSFLLPEFDLVCRASQSLPQEDPDALLETLMLRASQARAAIGGGYFGEFQRLTAGHGYTQHDWDRMSPASRNDATDSLRAEVLDLEHTIIAELQTYLA